MPKKKVGAKKTVTGRPESRTAKTNRPSKAASRSGERPQRRAYSIGEFRDILGVLNKDPEYRYRWILSTAEFDKRIFDARRAGWEFVDATKENELMPKQCMVDRTDTEGSLYRIPAGRRTKDEYLYLMRMPEDYAREVDAWKEDQADAKEADMFRKRDTDDDDDKGQYSINQSISHMDMHRPE